MPYRSVACQSSAGVSTGMSISWAPIAFCSSRTICAAFSCTFQPSGRYDQMPGADLADVAAAHEELVARGLGVGRIVPKRRDEERRKAGHGLWAASAIMSAAGFASFVRFGRSMPAPIHWSISRNSSSTRISDSTFLSTRPCA